LASNIKNEVVGVELFFFLLKEIWRKKIPYYVFFDVGP
jgi:hypothetical protein